MTQYLGLISGIFILLSFVPYLRGIFRNETKPERASWLIWSLLGGIATFTQLSKGATDSLWLPALQTIGDFVVFLLAIKYGMGGLLKRDKIALVTVGLSLILWWLTKEATVALLIVIFIDAVGALLTILKTREHPSTEPLSSWALTCLAGLIGMFAVGKFDWVLLAFPIYIFVANLAIITTIIIGQRRVSPKRVTFVTSYVGPDLDGLACTVAYSEFLNKTGVKSLPVIFGEPHLEAKYVMKRFHVPYPDVVTTLKGAEKVILVDASTIRAIDESIEPENVVEIIDHRKVNDAEIFKNAKIHIELIGAAATLVAERFLNSRVDISVHAATLLYGAILSNTLNLRSSHTTERDRIMARWLNEKVNLPDTFAMEMFRAKSDLSGNRLRDTLWGDYSEFTALQKSVGVAQLEIVDAKKLVAERKDEIIKELTRISKENDFIFTFLSVIDLEEMCNYFVTDNKEAQELLQRVFKLVFTDGVARSSPWLMRKQVIPVLKEVMEKE